MFINSFAPDLVSSSLNLNHIKYDLHKLWVIEKRPKLKSKLVLIYAIRMLILIWIQFAFLYVNYY